MSQKEIINKAYGNIPKETQFDPNIFSWLPKSRGVKYYWYILLRKLRNFKWMK